MIPIRQDILPRNRRPGHSMVPEWVTIHQTGNTRAGANAAAHAKFLQSRAPNPSWHYTVDDQEIWQHLPLNENGWHAGDGTNGAGNRRSIGVEGCINSDGNLARAEDNMAWLVAKLIRDVSSLRPFPECVVQHHRWNGKNCPAQIRNRENGWQNFLRQVDGHMRAMSPSAVGTVDGAAISIRVNGRDMGVTGVLRKNRTEASVSEVIRALGIGATVTGHGSHINIQVPELVAASIAAQLEQQLSTAQRRIGDAVRILQQG